MDQMLKIIAVSGYGSVPEDHLSEEQLFLDLISSSYGDFYIAALIVV